MKKDKKKTNWSSDKFYKSCTNFRMLLSKKYLRKKNLFMTCLRFQLYFLLNKNQFILIKNKNKSDYIAKK